jgi:hypothetical protein
MEVNFSLFTFHFSLFFVPLQPHFGKSGAFDDVNRLVIRQERRPKDVYANNI